MSIETVYKQYAMVPINCKVDDDGVPHIRRVLISFNFSTTDRDATPLIRNYQETRFVAADPYFGTKGKSHVYGFNDGWYYLRSIDDKPEYEPERKLIDHPRLYHVPISMPYPSTIYKGMVTGIPEMLQNDRNVINETRDGWVWEFLADSEENAIKFFRAREEVYD